MNLLAPVTLIITPPSRINKELWTTLSYVRPKALFLLLSKVDKDLVFPVDWPCDFRQYQFPDNAPHDRQIAAGLDWVFEQTEESIIISNDYAPSECFFYFCQALLNRYRDDLRVMSISGNPNLHDVNRTKYSYYFSFFPYLEYWATWRRVWKNIFDYKLTLWPMMRDGNWLMDIIGHFDVIIENHQPQSAFSCEPNLLGKWQLRFDALYDKQLDNLTYRFLLCTLMQNGLNLHPTYNLDSAKTLGKRDDLFPLQHPPFIMRNARADLYSLKFL